jgi:hypothetical protein
MDTKTLAVGLAALLLASVLGLGIVAELDEAAAQSAGGGTTTVSVGGAGEVTVDPDRAVVTVTSAAVGENASAAASTLAAQASRLRTALDDVALPIESVRTVDYRVFERREDNRSGVLAVQTFEVTLSNTSAAGRVVDVAVANGATGVDGVTFTLSNDRRAEFRATAIDRAVADARSEADAVANSTDLALGPIRTVSVTDGGFRPVSVRAADEGTSIDPRPVTVSASVQITYNATTG